MTNKDTSRYEVPLLLTFLLVGVAGLWLPRQTSSTTLLTMPTQLLYVWYGVCTVSGGVGLIGIVASRWPSRWLLGQTLLRFGLGMVAFQLTVYGAAAVGVFNLRALFASAILLAFAWACWSRVWSISKDTKEFRRALASQLEGAHELGTGPPGGRGHRRPGGVDRPSVADPEGEGGDEENQR